MVARGEVWWGETPEEKGRPFLVVSRDSANAVMQRVLVEAMLVCRLGALGALGPREHEICRAAGAALDC